MDISKIKIGGKNGISKFNRRRTSIKLLVSHSDSRPKKAKDIKTKLSGYKRITFVHSKFGAEYKIREKRDDTIRNYKIKITPSDGKNIKYTAEGSFKKMISIIKNWDDFKDDEIKSFEMTLATYGYLFCNTEKINISVLEVT